MKFSELKKGRIYYDREERPYLYICTYESINRAQFYVGEYDEFTGEFAFEGAVRYLTPQEVEELIFIRSQKRK